MLCVCVLVDQVEQMNNLLLQKQKELVVAVSKVEDLSKQLETLKNGQLDALHSNHSSVAELDRLYRELQVRAEDVKINASGLCSKHLTCVCSPDEEEHEPGAGRYTAAAETEPEQEEP